MSNESFSKAGAPAVNFRRGPGAGFVAVPEKAQNQTATVKRFMEYLLSEKILLASMLLCVLLAAVASVAAPAFQSRAVDVIVSGEYSKLYGYLLMMLLMFLVLSAASYLQGFVGALLSKRIITGIRTGLFDRIMHLPVGYVDSHSRGDLISRMTNDADNIANTISMSLGTLFSAVITLTATVSMMLWFSVPLTVCSCVTIVFTLILTKIMTKYMRRYFVRRQELLGELNGRVEETVTNYRTVAAYGLQSEALAAFEDTSDRLKKTGIIAEIIGSMMGPVMNTLNNITFLIVAVCGGYLAMHGSITVGVISAFIIYSKQMSRPVNELAQIYSQIQTALAGAERIFGVMDETSEDSAGKDLPEDVKGVIEFRNVNFSYVPGCPVISDFSLRIGAGRKIALVGATGSGKTTVINLLLRFYEADSGEITVDGRNIRDISLKSLRDSIGIVLQDTVLFSGTVKENLAYALGSEPDESEIERAARLSNTDVIIEQLPHGLDTMLEDAGARLSAGQRQLFAICRAFLSYPRILILDEATSSVDTRTEKHIQEAMVSLMKDRTSLIIAHRLSTIMDADEIIVMEQGRIVERGRHEELLSAGGRYSELYRTQYAGLGT